MMDMAVIGSEEFVLGFRLAGIRDIFQVGPEGIAGAVRQVMERSRIGIVVMHEPEISVVDQRLRDAMMSSIHPVFIMIGGEGSDLRGKVRRAIGVDLYGGGGAGN